MVMIGELEIVQWCWGTNPLSVEIRELFDVADSGVIDGM